MGEPELVLPGPGLQAHALLVWRWSRARRCVASGPLGGGLGPRRWVLNAEVDEDYGRTDPGVHLRELALDRDLSGPGVGLLTAASLSEVRASEVGGVRVDATVGISLPVWASDRSVGAAGSTASAAVGTVNIVVQVPVRLSDAALVNAAISATEAKAQAFFEAGVPGTGTATDALCVACVPSGEEVPFGGPRSTWGARIATAVHEAVGDGIQAWNARGAT